MKHLVLAVCLVINWADLYAQVGIGTTTPKAFFNVATGRDVLFGENLTNAGNTNKLIWYADKAALRAGYVDNANWNTVNTGQYSVATGYNTKATGNYSTALGFQTRASGYASTALGANVSTNSQVGSFIIGDYATGFVYANQKPYQMMMRFSGGYMLYSSAPSSQSIAVGVQLAAGGNAWTTLSDSTRKENFRKAEGASFLQKIPRMRLGSWNYKGQDARRYRHYGPMAQDFFAAFGHDELGTIGEDTSINQADFDGVNLIATQALIQEVNQLKA
ncbi:tail fiber domain-containing protein [Spirosoma koreense]